MKMVAHPHGNAVLTARVSKTPPGKCWMRNFAEARELCTSSNSPPPCLLGRSALYVLYPLKEIVRFGVSQVSQIPIIMGCSVLAYCLRSLSLCIIDLAFQNKKLYEGLSMFMIQRVLEGQG